MHAEGVGPEPIGVFGIARGDVAGDAFVEPEAREQAERARQMDFAMATLLFGGSKDGRPREIFDSSWSFNHKFKNTDFAGS